MYLNGEQVEVKATVLSKMISTKVSYLLERDIDKSGRGVFFPRNGVITEVYRGHIDFGNGCLEPLKKVREIVLI